MRHAKESEKDPFPLCEESHVTRRIPSNPVLIRRRTPRDSHYYTVRRSLALHCRQTMDQHRPCRISRFRPSSFNLPEVSVYSLQTAARERFPLSFCAVCGRRFQLPF